MTTTFKRTVARGFTLIELLIVVIIVAILAAIVIPQFSASTNDAQVAALDANLAAVRNAVEQYRGQHGGNVYPGAVDATGATCAVGTKADTGATAGTEAALLAQLTGYSNDKGQTCSAPNIATGYKYGPYLRAMPTESVGATNVVTLVTKTGAPLAADNKGGWAYDTVSGQFIMNNTTNDPNGKKYSDH